MKRKWLLALMAAVLCLAAMFCVSAAAAEPVETEWTVMFYLCGSDLESAHSFATSNLEEISNCHELVYVQNRDVSESQDKLNIVLPEKGRVKIVIETGGSKTWHAQSLGMNIDSSRLQRWEYSTEANALDASRRSTPKTNSGFRLIDSQPLASMSNPDTLADFIRWAAENYPARKYALVLWDHGGGSKTGIFIDELFDNDILTLNELYEAFRDGGVNFEAVLFDACMMANLETAYSIKDSAKWMIASEEVVAGKGTAIGSWLQQLIYDPICDGERLGRWICDMTQIKYANEDDEQTQNLMTWSVIDLSAIDRVAKCFDDFFEMIGQAYDKHPLLMELYARALRESMYYGGSQDSMIDLAEPFYKDMTAFGMDAALRREMLDAVTEAVVYCVKGVGRSSARGLSFCYAVDFDVSELESYSHNCPSAHYLAFLDAISPWTAPDDVYKVAARLEEISDKEEYQVRVKKEYAPDGVPGFSIVDEFNVGASTYFYNLYRKNDSSGQILYLGAAPTLVNFMEDGHNILSGFESWLWPCVEGTFCSIEMLSSVSIGVYDCLYNIPIQIGTDVWDLRVNFNDKANNYSVHGLWEGYDSDSQMFNRNVKSLSQFIGQRYRILYPIDTQDYHSKVYYEASKPATMYHSLIVEDRKLPAGTYYLEYVVNDLFMRPMKLNRFMMIWDGQNVTFPRGFKWEGEVTLSVDENYW